MLPRFSLQLPQTLRRESPLTLERPRSHHASREAPEWSSLDRKSFDQIQLAPKSAENVSSGLFSSISTVFRFADFASKLDDVSEEVQVFAKLIQRVRQDVDRANQLRLSRRVMERCNSWPEERSYIDNTIVDVQYCLDSIGAYVDNARVNVSEAEGGTVSLKHKFEWVLRHHHNLLSRQVALIASHHSLTTAISMMLIIESGVSKAGYTVEERRPTVPESRNQQWLKSGEVKDMLRSPHTRQKWRSNHRNSMLPSILASDLEEGHTEVNVTNIKPVELVGSTPDDLPLPENMDLYAMPSRPRPSREQVRRMPTLAERVERDLQLNGLSTASTNPADKPILAKRYRRGAVQVRNRSKPTAKHRSLPTRLPTLPSHPSLITELSRWVLPEAPRSSFDSSEADSCETPSTSVASSPAVMTSAISCPERIQTVSPTTAWTQNTSDTDAGSVPPATAPCPKTDDVVAQSVDNQNVDVQNPDNRHVSDQNVDDQKFDNQKVDDQKVDDQNVDEPKIDDQNVDEQNADDQNVAGQNVTESTSKAFEKSVVGEVELVPPKLIGNHPTETKVANEDAETKAPQNHSIPIEAPYKELTPKQDEPESKTSTPPMNPEPASTKIPQTTPPLDPTSLLTSHAKRRRAHARRMEAAYGS